MLRSQKLKTNECVKQLPSFLIDPGCSDDDTEDDDDLEAELDRIISGMPSSPVVRQNKDRKALSQQPFDLDKMVKNCLADEDVILNSLHEDDVEEDKELIAELDSLMDDSVSFPAAKSRLTIVEERIVLYKQAVSLANDAGRKRRYSRALTMLRTQRDMIKSGVALNDEDIPPNISLPTDHPIRGKNDENKEETNKFEIQEIVAKREEFKKFDSESKARDDKISPNISLTTDRPNRSKNNEKEETSKLEIQKIVTKREEFKKFALESKARNDRPKASLGLQGVKMCDEMIRSSQLGNVVDVKGLASLQAQCMLPTSYRDAVPLEVPAKIIDISEPPPEVIKLPPSTIDEALKQRLDKYKMELGIAKDVGNAGKVRRISRICTQYEEAIRLHRQGKSVAFNELPTPLGYAPIPDVQPAPPKTSTVPVDKAPVVRQKTTSLIDKQLAMLKKRQVMFRGAALEAKKAGQLQQAREYLRSAKGFDKLILATQSGLPIDTSTMPVPPQLQAQSVNVDFEIISREEISDAMCASASGTERQEMFSTLEADLIEQIKMCEENQIYFRAISDIASSNRFQQMGEHTKKDLHSIRFAFKRGDPVPKHHYEIKSMSRVQVCTDLSENQMEISIIRGNNYNLVKEADTFVRLEVPYPKDAPFKIKTLNVRSSNNPQYDHVTLMPINVKDKMCCRLFKRHRMSLEVFSVGGFLRSNVLIGSAKVPLQPLETNCVIHETFALMDGRRPRGGDLEVKVRLRTPIVSKKIEKVELRWLVVVF